MAHNVLVHTLLYLVGAHLAYLTEDRGREGEGDCLNYRDSNRQLSRQLNYRYSNQHLSRCLNYRDSNRQLSRCLNYRDSNRQLSRCLNYRYSNRQLSRCLKYRKAKRAALQKPGIPGFEPAAALQSGIRTVSSSPERDSNRQQLSRTGFEPATALQNGIRTGSSSPDPESSALSTPPSWLHAGPSHRFLEQSVC